MPSFCWPARSRGKAALSAPTLATTGLSLLCLTGACGDDGDVGTSDTGQAIADTGTSSSTGFTGTESGGLLDTSSGTTTSTGGGSSETASTGGPSQDTGTSESETGQGTSDSESGPADDEPPPTEVDALLEWLHEGHYGQWPAEAAIGDSEIHRRKRVFVNPLLATSLGQERHEPGAASVKEIYDDGGQLDGWAVAIKVDLSGNPEADPDGSEAWYWLEYVGGEVFYEGFGNAHCTGCHQKSLSDHILTLEL